MKTTPNARIKKLMTLTPPEMVAEFHTVFGHGAHRQPGIPTAGECQLRVALIREELEEFEDALAEDDLVETADALGDLLYVILGGFLVFGLDNDSGARMMAEIHDSNMSKCFDTPDLAQAFIDDTSTETGPIYEYSEVSEGRAVVYHSHGPMAGKVVKNPSYRKPDLSFLNEV